MGASILSPTENGSLGVNMAEYVLGSSSPSLQQPVNAKDAIRMHHHINKRYVSNTNIAIQI